MDDKEKGRIEERDRCWHILVDEIMGGLKASKLWEQHETIAPIRKAELLRDLNTQVQAIAILGGKTFAYKPEDLIDYAKHQLSKETE